MSDEEPNPGEVEMQHTSLDFASDDDDGDNSEPEGAKTPSLVDVDDESSSRDVGEVGDISGSAGESRSTPLENGEATNVAEGTIQVGGLGAGIEVGGTAEVSKLSADEFRMLNDCAQSGAGMSVDGVAGDDGGSGQGAEETETSSSRRSRDRRRWVAALTSCICGNVVTNVERKGEMAIKCRNSSCETQWVSHCL